MKFLTVAQAAKELDLSQSRIWKLCQAGRLGHTTLRHGKSWVITDKEIAEFRATGPLPAGRPKTDD